MKLLEGKKTYIGAIVAAWPAILVLYQTLVAGGDLTSKWGAISTFIGALIVIYGRYAVKSK